MIDVTITALIVGVLAAVAAPKFFATLSRTQVEAAAKRIKVDLGYARQSAISGSSTITVQFATATDDYTIPALPDIDRPGQPYVVALSSPPYNATLLSATLGGDSDVQFDRFGNPDSGGTITVQSDGYQQTVTIDPDTGKATIP